MAHDSLKKEWYVFYTKSRQEKKVNELLLKNGFEPFLPTQKVMRQWSDRKKKVEVPLFNSYIFVNVEEHRLVEVLKIPGVSWSIRHNGRAAFLRQNEFEIINRYLKTGLLIEASVLQPTLEAGDKVRVIDGALKGMAGTLTKRNSENLFSIFIDSLSYSLTVQLEIAVLEKIK
jgi:transcription termination/antitermination protein NusG